MKCDIPQRRLKLLLWRRVVWNTIQEKQGNVLHSKKEMEILHKEILAKRIQTYRNSADNQLQYMAFIHILYLISKQAVTYGKISKASNTC